MSDKSKSSGSGISVAGIIGCLAGFFSNSTLTGLVGFGKAMMIGGATAFGAGLMGFVGGAAGGLVGLIVGRGDDTVKDIGMFVGAIAGGIYGGIQGYEFGEKAIIDPCNQTISFNIQSREAFNAAADKNTLVLTAHEFTPALKPEILALTA